MREPKMLLGALHEPVCINPENRSILEQQLRCAAFERPISPTELQEFGDPALEIAEEQDRSGELEFRGGRFFYPSHEPPARKVNIRGTGSEEFALVSEGTDLGNMERWRALQHAHAGAVYLHRGSSYIVREMDLEVRKVSLSEEPAPYYTQAIVQGVTEPLFELASGSWGSFRARLCSLRVTEHVVGYRKKSLDGETVLGVEDLDLPPLTFETLGVRLTLPSEADGDEIKPGAIHGLEHALAATAPFLAGCDRGDLGSAWYVAMPDNLLPAVFVFDRIPGGVGLSEKLFQLRSEWADASLRLLNSCPCSEGCPACLLSSRCWENNETLDKSGTAGLLLNAVIGRDLL